MAEKIPFETPLPIALELYKKVPPITLSTKAKDAQERVERGEAIAEEFATFYHALHQKLTHHAE